MKSSVGIFSVVTIGTLLRFYQLGRRSLWFDEAYIVLDSVGLENISKLLWDIEIPRPGIFYNVFMYYWRYCNPYMNEFFLRLPSLIFAVAAIVLVYKVTMLLYRSQVAAIISGILLAFSPLHIYYSQEATPYSLLTLLIMLSVYSILRFTDNHRYYLLYFLSNVIALYTHPIAALFFLVENIIIFIRARKIKQVLQKVIVADILIVVLWLPIVIMSFMAKGRETQTVHPPFLEHSIGWLFSSPLWMQKLSWKNIFYTFNNFAGGYNASDVISPFAAVIFLILFVWGIVMMASHKKEVASLLLVLLPIGIVFGAGKMSWAAYYVDRYFLPCLPFFYITIAGGMMCIEKNIRIIIIAGIIGLSVINISSYCRDELPGEYQRHRGVVMRKDIREAAVYIYDLFVSGDQIFHMSANTALPFEYYFDFSFTKTSKAFEDYPDRQENKQLILANALDNKSLKTYRYMIRDHRRPVEYMELTDYQSKHNRIWLVLSSWDAPDFDITAQQLLKRISLSYKQKQKKEFTGITVYVYEQKTPYKNN